jgi:hypothetical protein
MGCAKKKTVFVALFRREGGSWLLVSAEPTSDEVAAPAGAIGLTGSFAVAPNYGGCPDCRADSFCKCGVCNELGCWDSSCSTFTCPRCGNGGTVKGFLEAIVVIDLA